MSTTEFHTRTLMQLAQGLENGDFTSVEVVRALLERIEARDAELNAFITVTADEALRAAERPAAGAARTANRSSRQYPP